jgi:hypothetical protein
MIKKLFINLCFIYCLAGISLLSGCSRRISVSSSVKAIAEKHKTVALLPFKITLNLNKKQQAVISETDKAALCRTLSVDLQKKMYALLLSSFKKHPLSVTLQNVNETLAKLSENNIRFGELKEPDKSAIIKILGVDALIEPEMIISQYGTAYSLLIPKPILGIVQPDRIGLAVHDEYNLNIDFKTSAKDIFMPEVPFWTYKHNEWYQAANKIKKEKVEASNNFLEPLFVNVDELFKNFIANLPYQKK